MIGETVIAIGNPLGFQNTVTAGVISATDRRLDFARGQSLTGLVQTDASINPGNSGGPLLNVLGELIGVNSAIRGDAQNIGFAIPVDQLRELLPDLLDVERRYRVIDGLEVDPLGQPRITQVDRDSPAERAGLRVGDVVQSVNGRGVHEGIDYSIALIGSKAREQIDLNVLREGKPMTVHMTLDGRPLPDGMLLARERFGLGLEPLAEDVADALGFPRGVQGLLVTQLEDRGPATDAGIQLRDVVIAIGRHTVATPDDLGQLLEYVDRGERVPVTVLRVDRRMKLRLSGELTAR
jgi:serine protease Do